MILNGRPVVPPTCPSAHEGVTSDLSQVPFKIVVGDCELDPSGEYLTKTEVYGYFGAGFKPSGEEDDFVATEALVVSIQSRLARTAWKYLGDEKSPTEKGGRDGYREAEAHDHEYAEKLRQTLCGRVAMCHGVVNGECWALGESAMREVIEALSDES